MMHHRNAARSGLIVAGVALAIAGGGLSLSAVATAATQPATTTHAAGSATTAPTNACRPPSAATGAAPSSLSGPATAPAGGPVTLTAPNGQATNLQAICTWKATVPSGATPSGSDPTVTYTQLSNAAMADGTQYAFSDNGAYGVNCNGTVEVLNGFGGGGAQASITSGYCNTDGFVPGEGSVQAVDVGFTMGPVVSLTSFGQVFTSFESGNNIFYGIFYFCSQDPVGQQSYYACVYFDGGPAF